MSNVKGSNFIISYCDVKQSSKYFVKFKYLIYINNLSQVFIIMFEDLYVLKLYLLY